VTSRAPARFRRAFEDLPAVSSAEPDRPTSSSSGLGCRTRSATSLSASPRYAPDHSGRWSTRSLSSSSVLPSSKITISSIARPTGRSSLRFLVARLRLNSLSEQVRRFVDSLQIGIHLRPMSEVVADDAVDVGELQGVETLRDLLWRRSPPVPVEDRLEGHPSRAHADRTAIVDAQRHRIVADHQRHLSHPGSARGLPRSTSAASGFARALLRILIVRHRAATVRCRARRPSVPIRPS
jgi:hypothetical protein